MPILIFSQPRSDSVTPAEKFARQVLIELSESTQTALEPVLNEQAGRLTVVQVKLLRQLKDSNAFDSELSLVIEEIERVGDVRARFL